MGVDRHLVPRAALLHSSPSARLFLCFAQDRGLHTKEPDMHRRSVLDVHAFLNPLPPELLVGRVE